MVNHLESRWGAKVVGTSHHLSEGAFLHKELEEGAAGAQASTGLTTSPLRSPRRTVLGRSPQPGDRKAMPSTVTGAYDQ